MEKKDPVGVGETYGARRGETLRMFRYDLGARRFALRKKNCLLSPDSNYAWFVRTSPTRSVISFQRTSGCLLMVTKSPRSRTLVTPGMANSCEATGCPWADWALKKLMGC